MPFFPPHHLSLYYNHQQSPGYRKRSLPSVPNISVHGYNVLLGNDRVRRCNFSIRACFEEDFSWLAEFLLQSRYPTAYNFCILRDASSEINGFSRKWCWYPSQQRRWIYLFSILSNYSSRIMDISLLLLLNATKTPIIMISSMLLLLLPQNDALVCPQNSMARTFSSAASFFITVK